MLQDQFATILKDALPFLGLLPEHTLLYRGTSEKVRDHFVMNEAAGNSSFVRYIGDDVTLLHVTAENLMDVYIDEITNLHPLTISWPTFADPEELQSKLGDASVMDMRRQPEYNSFLNIGEVIVHVRRRYGGALNVLIASGASGVTFVKRSLVRELDIVKKAMSSWMAEEGIPPASSENDSEARAKFNQLIRHYANNLHHQFIGSYGGIQLNRHPSLERAVQHVVIKPLVDNRLAPLTDVIDKLRDKNNLANGVFDDKPAEQVIEVSMEYKRPEQE